MKFIDLFCGMGTIRMGFEQAGHECVFSVEWDKHKRRIYEVIFGHEPQGKDIRELSGSDMPISDCWCFGAPCQDFSIAGLRAGMDGDRSSLVKEVFRLVRELDEEHRPEWLLYENVKGMFSSNKGLDYFEILFEMATLGYDIEWQLLNSKDFGVPQNRERVFTLGHSRRYGQRKIFPIGEIGTKFDVPYEQIGNPSLDKNGCVAAIDASYYKGYGIRGNKCRAIAIEPQVKQIANLIDNINNPQSGRIYDSSGISPTLDTCSGGNRMPKIAEPAILRNVRTDYGKEVRKAYESGEIKESRHNMTRLEPRNDGISNTLSTVQKDNLLLEPCACLTPDRLEKRQNSRRFKEPGEPMFTLTKQDIHGVAIYDLYNHNERKDGICGTLTSNGNTSTTHCGSFGISAGCRIRRLTPRECMRLQGVPDYITNKLINAGISDTQMYRAAGDACTVNVIYEIAVRM